MLKWIRIISCMMVVFASGSLYSIETSTSFLEDFGMYADSTSSKLEQLQSRFFEDLQRISPEFATFIGRTDRYNDAWSDYSEEGYFRTYKLYKKYLEELTRIDSAMLSDTDQINYTVFLRLLEESLEEYHLNLRYLSLNQLSGAPFEVEYIFPMMPQSTEKDYHNILARLEKIPEMIDQVIYLMDKGVEEGLAPSKAGLHALPQRIEKLIPFDYMTSIFFQPFLGIPDYFDQTIRDSLIDQAESIILKKVYPAYQNLLDFVAFNYLPNCRETTGICYLKNGLDLYQYYIKVHTTTSLSPDEIHTIGLLEVARIRNEMEAIITECGFQGSVSDFLYYLNTYPGFFYVDVECLLEGYRAIAKQIESQLPILFGTLPKLPFEIVPVPAHSEQTQVGAYYVRGSLDSGRPGRFYVNTYDLATRPKWQMESLTLHEAIPGHHFQISLALENTDLPDFRKYTGYTAYVEGWALYAESLGEDLGLYRSPYSKFGRLIEEIWRAVRLVVDTGMHAFGWTREEAIAYFIEQTGISEREATTEVDRYIAWPGQALAYKIGELTIQRLKKQSQDVLGEAFDIRSFHDALLEQGVLPLDVCEKLMQKWLEGQQSAWDYVE